MNNVIEYRVESCWKLDTELAFKASFNDEGNVSYEITRNNRISKGSLNYSASSLFKSIINEIDYSEMEKFVDSEYEVIDGSTCYLHIYLNGKTYNSIWTKEAIKSKHVSNLYRAIRLCRKKNNYVLPEMIIE